MSNKPPLIARLIISTYKYSKKLAKLSSSEATLSLISLFAFLLSILIVIELSPSAVDALQNSINNTFQPNIDAAKILDNKTMILGHDIKHLVILLPNEAHESPAMEEEQRLINQPYVPQKAIVRPGTMITWFNADVDHDHKIALNDASSKQEIFDTGVFAYNEASKPIVVNNTSATFNYFEANVNNEDEDFVMQGEITVVNQPTSTTTFNNIVSQNLSPPSNNTTLFNLRNNIDTVGTYMVPTQDVDMYASELTDRGLIINSMYNFKDLRGGQEGTGDTQTLLLWGVDSSAMSLDKVISTLKEITPELPYG